MNRLILVGLMAGAMLTSGAWAETVQQTRMTTCNADAKKQSLAGDARKAFMKSCLSGQTQAEGKAVTQQQRMKNCNAEASAKQLKGDPRKAFMKSCLSNK